MCGENALSERKTQKRFSRFRSGNLDVKDALRSGRLEFVGNWKGIVHYELHQPSKTSIRSCTLQNSFIFGQQERSSLSSQQCAATHMGDDSVQIDGTWVVSLDASTQLRPSTV
ncbi:hypothetical protein COOONC_20911 [Cooperia oncophora]